jgi:hypothetical protein
MSVEAAAWSRPAAAAAARDRRGSGAGGGAAGQARVMAIASSVRG